MKLCKEAVPCRQVALGSARRESEALGGPPAHLCLISSGRNEDRRLLRPASHHAHSLPLLLFVYFVYYCFMVGANILDN